jgi:hypothetical protein
MVNQGDNAGVTVEILSEQIEILQSRVDQLSTRLQALEQGKAATSPPQHPLATPSAGAPQALPPLFDTSALLPRISTICFLLVIALILRTITDNQIIDTRAGSILGMAYAGVLILLGWRLYAKNSRLAPVFPGCGILLLFSIVLETHKHYASLSTDGAYTILFLAGATVFALSIRYRASYLICLAVPGAAATAMAIDFPYPDFLILSLLLLSAIIGASYAFKQQISALVHSSAGDSLLAALDLQNEHHTQLRGTGGRSHGSGLVLPHAVLLLGSLPGNSHPQCPEQGAAARLL